MDKEQLQAAVDAIPYWYHRIELPHGIVTPGNCPHSVDAYRIPDDLTGRSVLDVGAWDGFWAFEAVKRGSSDVLAIDDFSDTVGADVNADRSSCWKAFDLCRSELGFCGKCIRYESSVLDSQFLQRFRVVGGIDVVFLFGVLYHLRHPLYALENLRKCCKGEIYIETAILDGCTSAYGDYGFTGQECLAEFYPGAEYGINRSNWHVGTLRYWCAMVEAAGFINITSWKLTDTPKVVGDCRGFIRAEV